MLSVNVAEFISELNKETDQIFDKFSKAVEGAAAYGWEKVVDSTPVDTGRARYSWNVSTDPNDFIEVPAVPRGTKNFYPYPVLPSFSFDVRKDEGLQIQNNVEYIDYLEEGSRTVEAQFMIKGNLPNIKRSLNVRLSRIR